jgi:hypothetical protein
MVRICDACVAFETVRMRTLRQMPRMRGFSKWTPWVRFKGRPLTALVDGHGLSLVEQVIGESSELIGLGR